MRDADDVNHGGRRYGHHRPPWTRDIVYRRKRRLRPRQHPTEHYPQQQEEQTMQQRQRQWQPMPIQPLRPAVATVTAMPAVASTTAVAAATFLLLMLHQCSNSLVDAATTTSSSLLSPWSSSLLQQLPHTTSSSASASVAMRRRSRRRRNNTGFFYGIREDDILSPFFSNNDDHYDLQKKLTYDRSGGHREDGAVGSGGAPMQRWLTMMMRQSYFQPWWSPQQQKQPQHPHMEDIERQVQMISTRPIRQQQQENQQQRARIQHRQQNEPQPTAPQLPTKMTTAATAATLASTTTNLMPRGGEEGTVQTNSKRRKRRNNTGFYYGIREDVMTMPSSSSAPPPNPQSSLSSMMSSAAPILPTPTANTPPSVLTQSPMNVPERRQQKQPRKDVSTRASSEDVKDEMKNKKKKKLTTATTIPKAREDDNNASNDRRTAISSKDKSTSLPTPKKGLKNGNRNNERSTDNNINDSLLLSEAIQELRGMREEIIALREELRAVKKKEEEDRKGGRSDGIGLEAEDNAKSKWWRQPQQPQLTREDDEENEFDYRTDVIPERWEDCDDPEDEGGRQQQRLMPTEWDTLPNDNDEDYYYDDIGQEQQLLEQKQQKREQLERIGKEVEQWATALLSEEEGWGTGTGRAVARGGGDVRDDDQQQQDDGWKEITCNNFVKKKFNQFGQTRVFLKWMPDSRNENDIECTVTTSQQQPPPLYPCLKCYSTIDAPLDRVCSFLANPETMTMYNELIDDHRDVEVISPSSKITWCKVPKILFVKPRDFVTYCSHRWKRDGTQVIVNQACEHEDMPGVMVEGQGDVCRGFALRGANFISKDPDDPNKTRITMLSHANPGGGLPQWAMNTAVNAAVQIEPFKFFHKINESICNYQEPMQYSNSQMSNVGGSQGRSNKPAGIAHLGFTCFWPNGGGLKESGSSPTTHQRYQQQDMLWENEDDDTEMEEHDD